MPPTAPSDFRLPCTTVRVRLALTGAGERRGVVFLPQQAFDKIGLQATVEILNAPDGFFPFRTDGGDEAEILLVAKAHTVSLVVDDADKPAGSDRGSPAKTLDLEVALVNGAMVAGTANVELPDHQSRLLDFLNATARPFFTVRADGATHYLNRHHVLYARPKE